MMVTNRSMLDGGGGGSTLTITTTISDNGDNGENGEKSQHDNDEAKASEPTITTTPKRTIWRKVSGITFAMLMAAFYALANVFSKVLQKHFHPFCITFWCFFGFVIPSLPIMLFLRLGLGQPIFDNIWPTKRANWSNIALLAGVGIVNTATVHLRFAAVGYLTVADCTVIMNCGTIFTLILAHVILKERCGVVPTLAALWILFGVALIARPPFLTQADNFDIETLIGLVIAIAAVISIAILSILVRKTRQVHYIVTMMVCGLWGLAQAAIVAAAFDVLVVPQGQENILNMCALGVFIFLADISLVMALKFEETGIVSLIRSTDVIFGFIFQSLILGTDADLISYGGATIVLSGVVLIAFRKWLGMQKESSAVRKWLGWLLA